MTVWYTRRALTELDAIQRYISKHNPQAAWVVASFIRRDIRMLERWPYLGRATEKQDVRRLTVTNYPYVVYYLVSDDAVSILQVRHSARQR